MRIARSSLLKLSLLVLVLLPRIAEATSAARSGLQGAAGQAGLEGGSESLVPTIGSLIGSALGLMGIIFVILVIYAGFLWMTAGGNEEKITKAKKLLIGGIIGMVIMFSAYVITDYVLTAIGETTSGGDSGGDG